MKHVYVDASVLLRVVLDEPNPLEEWDALQEPVASTLAQVEGLRTIDRATRKATHPRKKPLTEGEGNSARVRLYQTLEMFSLIDLEASIMVRAGHLAGPLGTLDALHLAMALAWGEHIGAPPTLATHDPELGAAAAAHGLQVIGLPG